MKLRFQFSALNSAANGSSSCMIECKLLSTVTTDSCPPTISALSLSMIICFFFHMKNATRATIIATAATAPTTIPTIIPV